jgi:hypothetical protein
VIRSNRVHRACIWSSDAPVLAARFSDDARTRRLKLPKLQQATQEPCQHARVVCDARCFSAGDGISRLMPRSASSRDVASLTINVGVSIKPW